MDLKSLSDNWNRWGEMDPMWAVLTNPQHRGNQWEANPFFETGFGDISHCLKTVSELRFPLRRGAALDFGCGVGRLSQALACYFDEVHGVDIAESMIRRARLLSPYGERARFYVNECDDLSLFANDRFDFIYSLMVLQHMPPEIAKRYIAEFLRVLSPGGLMVIQQPSHYSRRKIAYDHKTLGDRAQAWLAPLAKTAARWLGRPDGSEPLGPADFDYAQIGTPKHKRLPPRALADERALRIDAGSAGQNAETAPRPAPTPRMEFHLIPRREMLAYLKRLGGRVVHVVHRSEASEHHPSYRYYVTK